MCKSRKYTEEQLIEILRSLNKVNVSKIDLDSNPDLPGSMTIIRYFGSWNRALELAGLQPGIKTGRKKTSIERYINKHTIMGMLSKRYTPFKDWRGFYKNKEKTKAVVFNNKFPNIFPETNFSYIPKKSDNSYSSTILISNFNEEFFTLSGQKYREIRETRNKWNKSISIKDQPNSIQEVVDLIDKWDNVSGEKYGYNKHSGYDKNFFQKYWKKERKNLYSLFFYLNDVLVGYSIVSKLQDDDCFRYVIRKVDITVGRNICLYVDYKTFENIFNDKKEFFINWGASSGRILEYKKKFPIFKTKKVYFYKVKND